MDTIQAPAILRGVLTERDLPEAEGAFPGITGFFARCRVKPTTFLELVFAFERQQA